jgi:hypothetical protein
MVAKIKSRFCPLIEYFSACAYSDLFCILFNYKPRDWNVRMGERVKKPPVYQIGSLGVRMARRL